MRIVRKTLKLEGLDASRSGSSSSDAKYENEDRILTLLRSLRHDNIVRLLASYTIEASTPSYNFLFPLADATLSQALESESRALWDGQFPSDYALFQQLYGLASAIQSLHGYVSADGLELIGCHHDLKPQNILIDKGKLLLADFGLSRVHPDDSKSSFKAGQGDYMAPECEPVDEDGAGFQKGTISRPSDIWSLGCVVLEILIYHTYGRQDVVQFRDLRRKHHEHLRGGLRYRAPKFYSVGQKKSAAVTEWLQRLGRDDHTARGQRTAKFRPLLESMLQIPPESRPAARDVTFELFFQAQQIIYEESNTLFEKFLTDSPSLDLQIEHERFLAWGWGSLLLPADAQGFSEAIPPAPASSWMGKSPDQLADISKWLALAHSELHALQAILDSKQHQAWPVYKTLRELIDKLWDLQRQQERTDPERTPLSGQMRSMVERKMLSSEDLELLERTSDTDRYTNIARLFAWKYMTKELENDKKSDEIANLLFLDEIIETRLVRGFHCFGTVTKSRKQTDRTVLVEYMDYLSADIEQRSRLLHLRAMKLASLLSGQRKGLPDGFRILECIGYFHDPSRRALGFMYDFPEGSDNGTKPLTLKELIRGFARPELGALFVLASTLAQCVAAFHKVGWLHKNISAHNVLFFDSQLAEMLPSDLAEAHERGRNRIPIPRNASARPRATSTAESLTPSPSATPPVKQSMFKRMLSRPRKAKRRSRSPQAASPTPPLPSTSQPPLVTPSSDSLVSPTARPVPTVTGDALKRPYVVGFNHTRENESAALTTEASRDPAQQLYQHPRYLGKRPSQRFQEQYDWYSLGVVLLEIGLWQDAEEMAPGLAGQEARDRWLSQCLPLLGATMGSTYQDAVSLCLEYLAGDENRIEDRVVPSLMKCYA